MIRFLKSGLLTTIQDNGRNRYQRYGVTVSGAMDKYAFKLSNLLVGNDIRTALLEFTGLGPVIEFESENIFAVSGGIFDMKLNGRKILMNKAYLGRKGDILEIGYVRKGMRGYLAFSGGIYAETIMGSKATYVKGKLGGLDGRPIKEGDELSFENPKSTLPNFAKRYVSFENPYLDSAVNCPSLRVLLGPQDDCFTKEGINTFLTSEYTVTKENDRMGYRLEGPEIEYAKGQNGNIITDGVPLGAIQVPSGKPIILMTDRQTTGGYTKIGSVISVDLALVAQMSTNNTLRFVRTDIRTAQKLYIEQNENFARLKQHFDSDEILEKHSYCISINNVRYKADISEIR